MAHYVFLSLVANLTVAKTYPKNVYINEIFKFAGLVYLFDWNLVIEDIQFHDNTALNVLAKNTFSMLIIIKLKIDKRWQTS